jgi:hypothetical protein
MSSNRLKYDSCAYIKDIKESTEPLQYNMFLGKYENCKSCPIGDYGNILPFGAKTEVESELLGINQPATKCTENKKPHNLPLSAARMCDSIYYITPNNIEKPTSNMLPSMAPSMGLHSNAPSKLPNTKPVEKFTDMSTYEKYLKCRYLPSKRTADCLAKCKENDIVCRRPCVDTDINAWQVCHKNLDIGDRYDIGCVDDLYDRCMKEDDTNSSYNNLLKCLEENDIKKCDIIS